MKYLLLLIIPLIFSSCGIGGNFTKDGLDNPLSPQMSSRKVNIYADNNSFL